ncbi:hypothetical protein [Alcanivorax sp.]|uniref:hypothetical protein n=1 Tax=Alcanivorax sp. TaxID=1872427 RepID=UPI0025BB6976|nr:hypothetical protein [Alcanivorax sp.]
MNWFYLLPFNYFYLTRLRNGSILFHLLFEWLAAFWLVALLGAGTIGENLLSSIISYLAFISIYELGYIANDLHSAKREVDGRRRGPQDASIFWILLWVICRITVFFVCTILLEKLLDSDWWLFFVSLIFVFLMHNFLNDREAKTTTFAWLAWLRFMAPLIFVVRSDQVIGIGLAAAIGYVAYRQLGYMDSKNLLLMPGRKRTGFRLFFFLMPLVGVAVLWSYTNAQGYFLLTSYWAAVAAAGSAISIFLTRKTQ